MESTARIAMKLKIIIIFLLPYWISLPPRMEPMAAPKTAEDPIIVLYSFF